MILTRLAVGREQLAGLQIEIDILIFRTYMIRRSISVTALRTRARAEPMSGPSGQRRLPPRKSASSSRVLAALDTSLPTTPFRLDEDGVIDLTTPENDALSEAATAQFIDHFPSGRTS